MCAYGGEMCYSRAAGLAIDCKERLGPPRSSLFPLPFLCTPPLPPTHTRGARPSCHRYLATSLIRGPSSMGKQPPKTIFGEAGPGDWFGMQEPCSIPGGSEVSLTNGAGGSYRKSASWVLWGRQGVWGSGGTEKGGTVIWGRLTRRNGGCVSGGADVCPACVGVRVCADG